MVGRLAAAPLSEQSRREAQRNMNRYFAFLACETREPVHAARLLCQSVQARPIGALLDGRTWTMAAAILASGLLPSVAARMALRPEQG